MSIAERKQEEKQEMHKRILDAARKIFLEKGYEKSSIRNIASEINYSPGMIYFYFKDKNEIFHELHQEGFRLLLAQLLVLDSVVDPFERLKAVGRVFIQFAQDNKDYYNLMFIEEPLGKNGGYEGFQIAAEAINHLVDLIRECQRRGKFVTMDSEKFAFMFLSSVHGICALFCKDRTTNFKEHTNEELMDQGYDCFVGLLENG